MLIIRQQRVGKKNRPHFRVVLIDSKKGPRSGAFLEILGWRDPLRKEIQLEENHIKQLIGEGAQVSDSVHNMLVSSGVIEGAKIDVHSRKVSKKKAAARLAESKEDAQRETSPEQSGEQQQESAKSTEETAPAEPAGEAVPAAEAPNKEQVIAPEKPDEKKKETE